MIGRRRPTPPRTEVPRMSTQAVISEVRSVMFDVATWQQAIVERTGGQLGPVTREGTSTSEPDARR